MSLASLTSLYRFFASLRLVSSHSARTTLLQLLLLSSCVTCSRSLSHGTFSFSHSPFTSRELVFATLRPCASCRTALQFTLSFLMLIVVVLQLSLYQSCPLLPPPLSPPEAVLQLSVRQMSTASVRKEELVGEQGCGESAEQEEYRCDENPEKRTPRVSLGERAKK